MEIINFNQEDVFSLEKFLRNQYFRNKNTMSWLPERLHDMCFRIYAQESDQGIERSVDYIFLWKENGKIVACILPDGENIYFSIEEGYELLFSEMLDYSEKHCLPLFHKSPDGSVKFWTAVSNQSTYMQDILKMTGYCCYPDESYDNVIYPLASAVSVELPAGFRALYGEEYDNEVNKWDALHLGFHPDDEDIPHQISMNPYYMRKKSSLYADSFECLVIDENAHEENNVCAYCFVYIDKLSKSALIEPVSTRERYRHKGLGTAILHSAVLRCKEEGIEKCYVDSFGQNRRLFYNSAGFVTEDITKFWYKIIG